MEGKGEEEVAENVVRFPRDWVGPLEDLVPIGSRARVREDDDRGTDPTPIAADDFWSESASAVHDAIQGPAVEPAPTPAPARRVHRRPLATVRGRLADWRTGLRWPVVAAAAVVVAVIAVATIGLTEGGPSRGPRATTTQDASVGASSGSAHTSAGAHAARIHNKAKHAAHHSASAHPTHDPASDRRARVASRARRDNARAAHKKEQFVRQHPAPTVVHQVTTVTVPSPPPSAADSAVTSAPTPVETVPPSAPAATSAADSGGSSSAGPAGPTGFGSVGSNCNPKCS